MYAKLFTGLGATAVIAWICAILLAVYGWVVNIIDLVGMVGPTTDISTLFIARILGIPFFPLGAILGWFA